MSEKASLSDQQIVEKARELAEFVSCSQEVDFYKRAEAKINQNERIQTLIQQIKDKQKEAVAFEHFQQPDKVKKVEQEIDELQDELDNIPIVREFQQSQTEVNDLLQMLSNIISSTVTDKINEATGAHENKESGLSSESG